ncbi:MAG: helix-turn-helix domain-containing protein [Blastocatellia bacterium]
MLSDIRTQAEAIAGRLASEGRKAAVDLFMLGISHISAKLDTLGSRAQASPSSQYLTASEAAEYFKVSARWLREQAKYGDAPHTKTGRVYKFNLAKLEEWLRQNGNHNSF